MPGLPRAAVATYLYNLFFSEAFIGMKGRVGEDDFRMTETEQRQSAIYPVKTTGGQERTVATFVAARAAQKKKPIYSILALDTWKGYVLFEAGSSQSVDESIQGFKHVRSKIPGMMQYKDIEKFLITK